RCTPASMPSEKSASDLFVPIRLTRSTGISASCAKVRPARAESPSCLPAFSAVRVIRRMSFDADQIRIEGLAAVVHLDGDRSVMLVEPLSDPSRVMSSRAFSLDEGHELMAGLRPRL